MEGVNLALGVAWEVGGQCLLETLLDDQVVVGLQRLLAVLVLLQLVMVGEPADIAVND